MSLFGIRKRDKSPPPDTRDHNKEAAIQSCNIHDGHIVRLLELEERIASNAYSLKNVEEVVQLYAVAV
jgi:hypothetical protein